MTASLPPPCKGANPRVAVPGAPHGMYVWAPNAYMLSFLEADVIGKDPTLCGASLLINWSQVETAQGVYDWSAVATAAAPFVSKGLTVNLLFAEATEGATNNVTPAWVASSVPTVACEGGPAMPVYWNAAYEKLWSAFIAAAIAQFSYNNSALAPNVGYLRFANGRRRRSPAAARLQRWRCLSNRVGERRLFVRRLEPARRQHHQRHGQPAHGQTDHGLAAAGFRRPDLLDRLPAVAGIVAFGVVALLVIAKSLRPAMAGGAAVLRLGAFAAVRRNRVDSGTA